jgi:zinc finger protein
VLARTDLDRQLVKSEYCTVSIPELELIIPPSKGQLTTIEGVLRDILYDLGMDQPLRRIQDEAAYEKIKTLLDEVRVILADDKEDGEGLAQDPKGMLNASETLDDTPISPFTIKLDDPSGSSFLEFLESTADPKWNMRTYPRTKDQNVTLGLLASDDITPGAEGEQLGGGLDGENEEIYAFPGSCSSCTAPLTTYMKKVNIPYFKVRVIAFEQRTFD